MYNIQSNKFFLCLSTIALLQLSLFFIMYVCSKMIKKENIIAFIMYLIYYSDGKSSANANPLYGPNVRPAQPNEFPFVVSISEFGVHRCTGSLISLKHVLTSGHCLDDVRVQDLEVRVGSADLTEADKLGIYTVKSFVYYEDWAVKHNAVSYQFNDLAILELVKRVNEPGVKPAPYNKKAQTDQLIGKLVVTAGWGSTDSDLIQKHLQTASLQVIDPETCLHRIMRVTNKADYNLDGILCTLGDPYVTLGRGDSGGPLLFNGVIVGINEASPGLQLHEDDHSQEQSVHTALSFYTSFIEDVLRNFGQYSEA